MVRLFLTVLINTGPDLSLRLYSSPLLPLSILFSPSFLSPLALCLSHSPPQHFSYFFPLYCVPVNYIAFFFPLFYISLTSCRLKADALLPYRIVYLCECVCVCVCVRGGRLKDKSSADLGYTVLLSSPITFLCALCTHCGMTSLCVCVCVCEMGEKELMYTHTHM